MFCSTDTFLKLAEENRVQYLQNSDGEVDMVVLQTESNKVCQSVRQTKQSTKHKHLIYPLGSPRYNFQILAKNTFII